MRDIGLSLFARAMRRLRWLFRRDAVDAAMDDEMRYHIQCETEERLAQGMSECEARRTAMRDFGRVEAYKDAGRDARGITSIDDLARDVGYAARVLRRNPGFTVAVIVTFALGIGCTTSIFSVIDGILLRALPYRSPDELVAVWERNDARKSRTNVVSVENFEAWRARVTSIESIAALVPSPVTLDGEVAEQVRAAAVSPSFFRMLGATPTIGRDFTADDELDGGARVVMLSDAFWRSHYGADPNVVGRVISVDTKPATIIGVMPVSFTPPRFGWMMDQPIWMPFAPTDANRSWGRVLHVIARMKHGVNVERLNSEIAAVSAGLTREHPERNAGWSAQAFPLATQISGQVRRPLLALFTAVALLLMMSAVNVASLVTAFVRSRAHELMVRRTIGATPARLVRQLLMQSVLLGAIGTMVGIALAVVCTRAIVALAPATVPRLDEIRIDGDVLMFAALIATATTAAFGLLAARGVVRSADLSAGRASSRTMTTPRSGASLIAAEVAIGVVLTVMATLMVRSFAKLRAVDLGFASESIVTGRATLPDARYDTDARRDVFFDALLARLRATPGVEAASLASSRPFACCAPSTAVRDLSSTVAMTDAPIADVRFVDDAFFSILRIPRLGGSVFASDEPRDGPVRVVVSKTLARTIWGDANPIGRTLSIKLFGTTNATVVGVVGDVHLVGARTPVRPTAYLSTRRYPDIQRDIIMKGNSDATALISTLRSTLAALDRKVPLEAPMTLEASVNTTLAADRFTTLLLSSFAALALVIAIVGVYGVLSADLHRRRKEIGIRLALGARASGVVALMVTEALRPAVAGALIGLVGALASARSLSSLVFGIGTWDPASFLGVALGLLLVSAGATMIAALRATRVSPVDVIRAD
ncbi:MAG TPA: ABC transporter permease [Gemmatimonadaceae bacterium]|jgi:putative ABC transport system permease protein